MPGDGQKDLLFAKRDLVFFLLFLLVFLALFHEFFFSGKVFFERDTTVIEIPARKLCTRLLKSGNFALWTDDMGMGQPFLANPKNAVFYPTTFLYLAVPFFTAFRLHYFLHALIGWLGLFGFGKSLKLSRRASFLGATLFVLSGMYLSSFEFYNHIAALAWMPWILIAASRDSRHPAARVCVMAILWTLMILAGTPEILLITAVLFVTRLFFSGRSWGKKTALVSLSLLLSLFLAAAQVLPSIELSRRSDRQAGLSAVWPLEMIQLPNLVFPHFLGNDRQPGHSDFWGWHMFDKHYPLYYSFYTGFGAFLLFLLGARKPWDDRRKWLLAAFALLFLVSNGRYSPFYFITRHIPFLALMRYPVKFFLGSVFALSFLAALGFDDLARGRGPSKRGRWILTGSAATAVVFFLLFKGHILGFLTRLFVIDIETSVRELSRSLQAGFIILSVAAAFLIAASFRKIPKSLLSWGLAALVVLDLAVHNRNINPVIEESFFSRPEILSTLGTPVRVFREETYQPDLKEKIADNPKFLTYLRESLYPYTGMNEGVRYVLDSDFYGLLPRSYNTLRRKILELEKEDFVRILGLLGCNYRIGDKPFLVKDAEPALVEGITTSIEKISDQFIRPVVVHDSVAADGHEQKLQKVLDRDFDPERQVIVEKALDLSFSVDSTADELTVLEESQGRGRYRVTVSSPGVLVIPGNHAPGWRAWIDGEKTEVFEANLFSKGVYVRAGRHEIALLYFPGSFLWGAAISVASFGALAISLLIYLIRKKRGDRSRPSLDSLRQTKDQPVPNL